MTTTYSFKEKWALFSLQVYLGRSLELPLTFNCTKKLIIDKNKP